MFKKVLIANRGEIAVRVVRACKELGITTVAVYSEVDRASLHVRVADEAYCIGPAPSNQSYLVMDKIIDVAREAKVDAIHPGYGFLSENADFAELCVKNDIIFIGPNTRAIRIMGNKTSSRVAVAEMNVPLVPGMKENLLNEEHCQEWAAKIGYPLMLKAAAGGGGKGMRKVDNPEGLLDAFRATKSEAIKSFNDDAIYMERYIESPRHIEIQVLGDKHGNMIHVGERECSIQRRHQKVLEEAPSPVVDEEMRKRMGEAALNAARTVNYDSAGTVEFIVSGESREFFFLEMNTRLQVEHPVTEMVTGIDLCKEMIRIAAGLELTIKQEDVKLRGHAIECRISAEDPDNDFLPTPGKIIGLRIPGGPGIRDESGMYEGFEVPIYYDPLISKLVVWGSDREDAIARCRRALSEYIVKGIKTTIPFHARVMQNEHFISGDFDTDFIDTQFNMEDAVREHSDEKVAMIGAAIKAFRVDQQNTRMVKTTDKDSSGLNPWKLSGRIRSHNNR
ncbi:MAG: acetyl-CoA carboxylase biotin carboxylase subunit [Deltaproteobacteria bacterium]|nr:MAG: acetyl-CoA carboxylase biotin carboxylase subunit [Deltaproteobacteria bacterium]